MLIEDPSLYSTDGSELLGRKLRQLSSSGGRIASHGSQPVLAAVRRSLAHIYGEIDGGYMLFLLVDTSSSKELRRRQRWN